MDEIPSKQAQLNNVTDVLLSLDSSLLIINAKVGNNHLNFKTILDTGSSFNFINKSVLKHISVPIGKEIFKVNSISGKEIIFDTFVYFSISIGQIQFPETKFIVYDDEVGPSLPRADILLGINFITRNKLILNVPKKKISIINNNNVIDIYCQLDEPETFFRQVICYATESISLEPELPSKIPVFFNDLHSGNDGLFLFSPNLKNKHEKKLEILEGVMKVNDDPCVFIINKNSNKTKIRKGERIGVLKQIVEVQQSDESKDEETINQQLNNVKLENLNKVQKSKVMELLTENMKAFSKGSNDVGFIKGSEMVVEVLDETPIYHRPRRFPQPVNEKIDAQVEELKKMDIIEESESQWSSAVVPVTKKNGEIRLCVDYRKLNKVIKNNPFPFPSLLDSVHNLANMKFFTCLDMTKGYYQLGVAKKSRPYLAFSTHRGHFQFKRCSFGLKTAPAAFQKEIQRVLQKFSWKQVIIFLDDICIMTSTFEEHIELLNDVLKTLTEYGIKLNLEKCKFVKEKVDFLGHEVSSSGLKKSKKYIDSIKSLQKPVTVTELRQFLGIINFQRKFIPNCSQLQKSLSEKTGGEKYYRILSRRKTTGWLP